MIFDKIKAPTVRESFVRELENKILSGELKPGDKLPRAKELCELMGVSLTVVNAGMSELANNGFVETIPRRGTYIADYKKKGNAGTLSAIMRYNGGKLSSKEYPLAVRDPHGAGPARGPAGGGARDGCRAARARASAR